MSFSTIELESRLFRFVAVGLVNTAFGYCVYAATLWIGLNYAAAAAISMIFGVFFNFKTTGRLVFGSKDNRLLLKFIGVYASLYVVNFIGLAVLTRCGLNAYSAGLVMLVPAAVFGFVLNKTLVFKAL
jgi:putative flippase GtrA